MCVWLGGEREWDVLVVLFGSCWPRELKPVKPVGCFLQIPIIEISITILKPNDTYRVEKQLVNSLFGIAEFNVPLDTV